jgi:hypothetical protein
MEAEDMSDALDDFATDEQDQFARTRAAYLELLQADTAFDRASGEAVFTRYFAAVDDAVQKVRVTIADDTCAYNDRNLILSLHEPTVRCLAARLAGVL